MRYKKGDHNIVPKNWKFPLTDFLGVGLSFDFLESALFDNALALRACKVFAAFSTILLDGGLEGTTTLDLTVLLLGEPLVFDMVI